MYQAINENLEQFALKVYFADDKVFNGSYEEALKQAQYENSAAGLKHQNLNLVIKFQPDAMFEFASGKKQKCVYVVYELLPNGSLGDRM